MIPPTCRVPQPLSNSRSALRSNSLASCFYGSAVYPVALNVHVSKTSMIRRYIGYVLHPHYFNCSSYYPQMHVERECSRYSKYRAIGDTSESGVDTASPVQKIKTLRECLLPEVACMSNGSSSTFVTGAACPKPRRGELYQFCYPYVL